MGLFTSLIETLRPLLPDSAAAWAVRKYINHCCEPIGQMTTLQIDPAKKTAVFELDLKGETQSLRVSIDRYELTTVGEKTFVEVKDFQTSREWINYIARELLKGRKFELPEAAKALL
ncbi:MAG TPA: hypothetical protein VN281_22790 [Verrucomicrobiae bacterium]|nr:hypothetical protein [Verrucomicrobiae bacterium]